MTDAEITKLLRDTKSRFTREIQNLQTEQMEECKRLTGKFDKAIDDLEQRFNPCRIALIKFAKLLDEGKPIQTLGMVQATLAAGSEPRTFVEILISLGITE
jgi:hypothetical protein